MVWIFRDNLKPPNRGLFLCTDKYLWTT
jgi:hypothetical protein